jgi:hypothetical protein
MRRGKTPGSTRTSTVELERHLFALEALLRAHIEREDGFLLQLLEEEAVGVQAITGGGAT